MKITPGTVIKNNRSGGEFTVIYPHKDLKWIWLIESTATKYQRWAIEDLIHTDGKPRKSGFSVVTWGPQE